MNSKRNIYFICPDENKNSGGVKQIYRQADLLNKNGYKAFVVHKKKGFRATWFENNTKIVYKPFIHNQLKYFKKQYQKKQFSALYFKILSKVNKLFYSKIEDNAILVFPEIYGPDIHLIEKRTEKVIFNQNCYYTFNNFSNNISLEECAYKYIKHCIVVSEDSKNYMLQAFPNQEVYRIHLGIDEKVFGIKGFQKKKQICYMPRKLENDIKQVVTLLKSKDSLKGWNFIAIENKSEAEVAKIFQESIFFLSFNHREGFGLPPIEAMSSETYVIGYTGQGGKEYFNPNFSSPIENGNIIEFVKITEKMINTYDINPDEITRKTEMAKKFVAENYNSSLEEKTIMNTWNKILQRI